MQSDVYQGFKCMDVTLAEVARQVTKPEEDRIKAEKKLKAEARKEAQKRKLEEERKEARKERKQRKKRKKLKKAEEDDFKDETAADECKSDEAQLALLTRWFDLST